MSKTFTKTFTKVGYRAYDNDNDNVFSYELKKEAYDCDDEIYEWKYSYARRYWRGRFPLSINQRELIDELCSKYEWHGANIARLKFSALVEIVETTDEYGDPVYEALGQKFADLDDIAEAIDWESVDEEPEFSYVEAWRPNSVVKIVESKDKNGYTVYEALGQKFDDYYYLFKAIDANDRERANVEAEDEAEEEFN